MAHVSRRPIPLVLWSNVPPAIRSREMMSLESQVAQADMPVIGRVYHRAAFAALYSFGTTLDELPPAQVPGVDKAKSDAIRLTDALAVIMAAEPDTHTSDEDAA